MKYTKILVGVDFSEASAQALHEAVRLASYDSTPVLVLHVVDRSVLDYLASEVVLDEARTLAESKARLDDFLQKQALGYAEVEGRVVIGRPFDETVNIINDEGVDLVILGSRGTSADPHRLGALVSKCLRKAPAAVMAVEERPAEAFTKVVCAIDYSDTGKEVLEQAIHLAKREQAELDVVHVYASPASFQDPATGLVTIGYEGIADYPKMMEQSLKNFLEPFRGEMEGLKVTEAVVDHMSVGRAIVNHLQDRGGDLLVLGTHGRTGWRTLLLGTTAEHIFHRIPCSTLAVKPKDFHFSARN